MATMASLLWRKGTYLPSLPPQCRYFGYGKHWKLQPSKKKRNKAKTKFRNTGVLASSPSHRPPPLVLAPTASRYVFAAKNMNIDPETLFSEQSLSLRGQFDHFSPASFGHELPQRAIPEVAFLGRSNVGKSSLINALTRTNQARTSKQPGRTQQVQYFGWRTTQDLKALEHVHGFLIDLPGYGFAVGPDEAVEQWQTTTQDFLLDRRDSGQLRRLYLLVDARRGALALDQSIMGWMDDAEIPYTVVMTKADRVGPPQMIRGVNEQLLRYMAMEEAPCYMSPMVHVTSSKGGEGIPELAMSVETEFVMGKE